MSAIMTPSPKWIVQTRDPEAESLLQRELGVSSLVAGLLVRQGLKDPAAAYAFLNPSLDDLHAPHLLPDYLAAKKIILGAKERGDLIYIHGDYDVDGVTSAALLTRFLTKIGCKVKVHVPHRMKEGYGIHMSAVDEAHEEGAKVFLTCDCGASALEQIARAKSYGMTVLVTDHHTVGETLPDADALINCHRQDSTYPFQDLSGAGVVFKFCAGLTQELGHPVQHYYRAYLDLAALGTIADVMPLLGENRIIARHGLAALSSTQKPGLAALKREAKVCDKVTSYTVGFQLGPRLNAAGRVDDAALALQLLLTTEQTEADRLAAQIEQINTARREEQNRIIEEAVEQVLADNKHEKNVIVVAKEGWHAGVIGIVAGRLVEQFRRPTFVFAIDPETRVHKGSARSIPKFHLADAIRANLHMSGGGHAMAAGCSLEGLHVDAAFNELEIYAAERLSPEDFEIATVADFEVEPEEITAKAMQELQKLEPFGEANPMPSFVAREMTFVEFKATKNPKVAQIRMRKREGPIINGISFDRGEELLQSKPEKGDVLFSPSEEEYRGNVTIKWRLRDYQAL
jgi:single-stranded-DNA-specific exonuclease